MHVGLLMELLQTGYTVEPSATPADMGHEGSYGLDWINDLWDCYHSG